MKRFLALILALCMVFALCACGSNDDKKPADDDNKDNEPTAITNPDEISDEMTSADGKYEIAFVTDVGQLKDKSFNQGTYDGVKLYAANNDKSYKYYQPANGDKATDDDRYDAMKAAVDNGAKVVVCAGFLQENALRKAALEFTDVSFVFIDGYPVAEEAGVDGSPIIPNIAGISFQEEQSGYLAGYAAVMEGYTKLGFCGGGGGDNPACCRFGYSWMYGGSFSASPELQTMAAGWYSNGTEVIFACGGSMFASVSAAASAADAKVIGVDTDQSFESDTVITSATKGLASSVQWALAKFYDGSFSDLGGNGTALGAKDDAVGLPTATWSLSNWSVDDYNALLKDIKDGKVSIDADWNNLKSTDNVTVNVIE